MKSKINPRKVHRFLVPICALPLIITSPSGSLYGSLIEKDIEVTWLLKMHTGNFGFVNLQPYYSSILGLLTVVLVWSGLAMFLDLRRSKRKS